MCPPAFPHLSSWAVSFLRRGVRALRVLVLLSTALVLWWALQAAFPEEGAWWDQGYGLDVDHKAPFCPRSLHSRWALEFVPFGPARWPSLPPLLRGGCLPTACPVPPATPSVVPALLPAGSSLASCCPPNDHLCLPPWAGRRLDVVVFCGKCTL